MYVKGFPLICVVRGREGEFWAFPVGVVLLLEAIVCFCVGKISVYVVIF